MSDQIRSMVLVLLTALLMINGFVVFLIPTFIGALAMAVLSFLIGYNWSTLEKFELR